MIHIIYRDILSLIIIVSVTLVAYKVYVHIKSTKILMCNKHKYKKALLDAKKSYNVRILMFFFPFFFSFLSPRKSFLIMILFLAIYNGD